MGRKNRIIVDVGTYHIYNKINEEKMLLEPENIKTLFLDVIQEAKIRKKFRFKLKNIVIMDNHIHLMIKMDYGESLSRLMQWIFSVFASRFNRIFNRKGHLWIDRFKSKVIESLKAYQVVFEYISNNPVKAGMVKNSEDYHFGYYYLKTRGNRKYQLLFLT